MGDPDGPRIIGVFLRPGLRARRRGLAVPGYRSRIRCGIASGLADSKVTSGTDVGNALEAVVANQTAHMMWRPRHSGRDQIQLPITSAARIGATDQGQGAKISAINMLSPKAMLAATFPLRLIAPRSRHETMWPPKTGWPSNRASSAGLLRAKQYAARITNTVVGITGSIAPIMARPSDTMPAIRYRVRRTPTA